MQARGDDKPADDIDRVHLDLTADDVEAAVDRLEGLGASRVEDWPYPPEATFVVMRDPNGDEFCVTERVEL